MRGTANTQGYLPFAGLRANWLDSARHKERCASFHPKARQTPRATCRSLAFVPTGSLRTLLVVLLDESEQGMCKQVAALPDDVSSDSKESDTKLISESRRTEQLGLQER